MTAALLALSLLLAEPAAARGVPVARVRTDDPVVALTFDACATAGQANGFDREVFEILKAARVPATIFLSGRWIEAHPAEARALAEVPFFELGNHGYAHQHLPKLGPRALAAEIDRTEALIAGLGRPSVGLRPPFGEWTPRVLAAADARGLPTVLWDVVSGDAGGHVPAPRMVETVVGQARPGSIVIFHINGRGPLTKEALPGILRGLVAKGLRFATVSELLAGPQARVVPAPHMRRGVRVRPDRAPAPGSQGSQASGQDAPPPG